MNFWDTVRGHELADILIRYLPKISKKVNKKQHFATVQKRNLKDELETRRDNDKWEVESITEISEQTVLVVFAEYK